MSKKIEFVYDEQKSQHLRQTRGIGFEEAIEYIENGWILGVDLTPNQKKYPGQFLMDVEIEKYVYTIPFYHRANIYELRTIYPNRKATGKYRKQGKII
jgi:uncharacterized DUF497 family protein